ncbi:hypothetical protein O7598_31245 [Micromonospora sp. WMMC241]|uniref:hypothetical protein n=1 Tax=Micromonospora sp. WMMC241 TaxID=3015159 RepID=UPI0022B65115|nr:hypothetical protein [Micromonospora sp. WMMC241]MCZ7434788.1 hypothetical protein [Micromonospora sp. WMMC241]MCZ7440843.1 hypothetical protein [Micromonospora sp. WMMC241]MCZ7440902.1 hypothetical protein [Micromonospora sp. WMMC241]
MTAPAEPRALCTGCGSLLDPAAAAGWDGTPAIYDRHPGCEKRGGHLRLVKGSGK